MTGFGGLPAGAFAFYEGLEADNSKPHWLERRDVHERDVRAPMDALVAELTDEFGEVRVFRPYRDTRFSADKSPYKTEIAATIGHGYVQLSADGLRTGAGMRHMAPDQLDRYRRAVDAEESARGSARRGPGPSRRGSRRPPPRRASSRPWARPGHSCDG